MIDTKKLQLAGKTCIIYCLIFAVFIIIPLLGSEAVTVISHNNEQRRSVIIDAGHGGIDSGAVSCTGVHESKINLEIALKLDDLMHLLGMKTVMIRKTDRSVYTQGNTISAQKISDIKERIRIVNDVPNGLLISIHQNNFTDSRYSGAQVFYNSLSYSKELAEKLQTNLRENLNPQNHRQTKETTNIYLMEHIQSPGILVECGFLSNSEEEAKLRERYYQLELCAIIASTISQYPYT